MLKSLVSKGYLKMEYPKRLVGSKRLQDCTLPIGYNIVTGKMSFEINGVVSIKDLWLKKVWEITRSMEKWPLNLQIKNGVVHKIRPGLWYSDKQGNRPMFQSLEHFLSAIEETMYQNDKTHSAAPMWKRNMVSSYKNHYDIDLEIPRWNDISNIYMPSEG